MRYRAVYNLLALAFLAIFYSCSIVGCKRNFFQKEKESTSVGSTEVGSSTKNEGKTNSRVPQFKFSHTGATALAGTNLLDFSYEVENCKYVEYKICNEQGVCDPSPETPLRVSDEQTVSHPIQYGGNLTLSGRCCDYSGSIRTPEANCSAWLDTHQTIASSTNKELLNLIRENASLTQARSDLCVSLVKAVQDYLESKPKIDAKTEDAYRKFAQAGEEGCRNIVETGFDIEMKLAMTDPEFIQLQQQPVPPLSQKTLNLTDSDKVRVIEPSVLAGLQFIELLLAGVIMVWTLDQARDYYKSWKKYSRETQAKFERLLFDDNPSREEKNLAQERLLERYHEYVQIKGKNTPSERELKAILDEGAIFNADGTVHKGAARNTKILAREIPQEVHETLVNDYNKLLNKTNRTQFENGQLLTMEAKIKAEGGGILAPLPSSAAGDDLEDLPSLTAEDTGNISGIKAKHVAIAAENVTLTQDLKYRSNAAVQAELGRRAVLYSVIGIFAAGISAQAGVFAYKSLDDANTAANTHHLTDSIINSTLHSINDQFERSEALLKSNVLKVLNALDTAQKAH